MDNAVQEKWGKRASLVSGGDGLYVHIDDENDPINFPVLSDLSTDYERSNRGEKEGNFLGAAFFATFAAVGGAAVAGAGAASASGTAVEGGEVLGGAESLSGASAESSVAASEAGAGAETASSYSFSDIQKGIQTGLSAAKAYQSIRNSRRAGGSIEQQSATPDYVGFGSSPRNYTSPSFASGSQSAGFSLSPIFLIAIALIAFVFILRR